MVSGDDVRIMFWKTGSVHPLHLFYHVHVGLQFASFHILGNSLITSYTVIVARSSGATKLTYLVAPVASLNSLLMCSTVWLCLHGL